MKYCNTFAAKISSGLGGNFVDGHWRRTKGGKMVWVKGHFRR